MGNQRIILISAVHRGVLKLENDRDNNLKIQKIKGIIIIKALPIV